MDRYDRDLPYANPQLRQRRASQRKKAEKRRRQLRMYRFMALAVLGIVAIAFLASLAFRAISGHKGKKDADSVELAINETENSEIELELLEEDSSIQDTETEKSTEEKLGEYIRNQEMQTEDQTIGEVLGEASSEDQVYVSQKNAADFAFYESEATSYMGSYEMTSEYGILACPDSQSVVAEKNSKTRISPASMTKVLTCLVACEHIQNIDDTVTITIEDTDYSYSNDCSAAGFAVDEVVTVRDLLYGTILPSGGDAAHALSRYVAGSHEAFVELMNQKLEALGLSGSSHFTNCVGIYNDNHYSTAYDIAVIMNAAMDNPLARQVLSAHRYTTSETEQHPEGIDLSNLFLRRIEDKDTKGEVIGAKTGYVNQSRNCAVSYYTNEDGTNYICVTATAHSAWRAVYDHVAVYNIYAAGNTGYHKDDANSAQETD